MERTYIASISKYLGKPITLFGWIHRIRNLGGIYFVQLRDRSGLVQLVFPKELGNEVKKIKQEYVVKIEGIVNKRPKEQIDNRIPTGKYEIHVKNIEVLNSCKELPFSIEREALLPKEELRLRYRYLDLRRERLTKNLKLRHELLQITRKYLSEREFWEIETPLLAKSTPEGARDFLVPSRMIRNTFYALPQSPQLYKQILMSASMDRYFQIARCLRDEELRTDRQPEFTQIDIEASFIDEEFIFNLIEGLFKEWFAKILKKELPTPFPRLSYEEALQKYGSDKPDLRFGLELQDFSDFFKTTEFKLFKDTLQKEGRIKGIRIKNAKTLKRKDIDKISEIAKDYGFPGLLWVKKEEELKGPLAKFVKNLHIQEGEVIIFLGGEEKRVSWTLGRVRDKIAELLSLVPADTHNLLWVYGFPLFKLNEQGEIEPEHHIFSQPFPEDLDKLETEPTKVKGRIYDLVWNGKEVGTGSIRVHKRELQEKLMDIAHIDKSQFDFFLEAMEYGMPPHGGIALGFDRIVATFAQTDAIRDVIAFPKTTSGQGLMEGSPSKVSPQQLDELRLKIKEEK